MASGGRAIALFIGRGREEVRGYDEERAAGPARGVCGVAVRVCYRSELATSPAPLSVPLSFEQTVALRYLRGARGRDERRGFLRFVVIAAIGEFSDATHDTLDLRYEMSPSQVLGFDIVFFALTDGA